MDHHDNEKKRRRVPPNLRRRALISCDRCKTRRIKCDRPEGNSDPDAACQACTDCGTQCQSTLPRKHRIYSSRERINSRYHVLDALVRGLYPDKDTEDIETLYSICRAHHIDPPLNGNLNTVEDAERRFSVPLNIHYRHTPSPALDGASSNNPFANNSKRVLEEKLIPSASGPFHYIGPSSSFGFVITVRKLVAEVIAGSKTARVEGENAVLQSDFAAFKTSKGLEPPSPNDSENLPDESTPEDTEESGPANPAQKRRKDERSRISRVTVDESLLRYSEETPLSRVLPEREIADSLVQGYFNRVHPNYLLFHRGTFQLRYETMWAEPKQLMGAVEPGWLCSVFMVFVFGARVLEHHDMRKSVLYQRRYLGLVQSRLGQLITTTKLSNIQALLLLQLHHHNYSERNTAWMLLGCASRMAMSLGMHREGATGEFDSIEREVRRRVWWTMYMFEKNLGLILGRPSAIEDSEVNVSIPNDTLLDGSDVPPGYVDFSVRLTKISMEIKQKAYAPPPNSTQFSDSANLSVTRQLLLDLESWYGSLPPYLSLEYLSPIPKYRRAVLLLHIQYYHLQALVTRPFLLRKVENRVACRLQKEIGRPDLDRNELAMSHACGENARQTLLLLQQLANNDALDGVARLDIYYFFHCVIILSVDFLARGHNHEDSLEAIARKTAVRNVFNAVQNKKLSPTFSMLKQVALQLAKIVGMFDEYIGRLGKQCHNQPAGHREVAAAVDFRRQESFEDTIDQGFHDDAFDLPWDLFASGGIENGSFYNSFVPGSETFVSMTMES
jgi:proline utilization trans-activator